jgi:hypothetical protein
LSTEGLANKKTIILLSVGVAVAIVISILAFLRGGPGLQGIQGTSERGLQGDNGLSGENGSQGIQGPMGPQGDQGSAGASGSQGVTGSQGPAGAAGENGVTPQLEYDNENNMIRWIYDNGTVTYWIALPQGPQGEQGPQGPAGVTGAQGPQGEQGLAGENGKDANLNADITGLLTYYPNCQIFDGHAESGTGRAPAGWATGWHSVVGFLVNFGTESAENVTIHMMWENVTNNVSWENIIYIGHLAGHGLYNVAWDTYVPGSDSETFNWSYEITWG